MKAYKVVFKEAGKLVSAMIMERYAALEYPPNKWVTRQQHCGPLCCFDTLENAKQFIINQRVPEKYFEIWECEIVKSDEERVWTTSRAEKLEALPEGTILADRLKLVRRVS